MAKCAVRDLTFPATLPPTGSSGIWLHYSNPATTSTSHFDEEAAIRGWYVAPDGIYRPTVTDAANIRTFTTDEFRDVCALVATA